MAILSRSSLVLFLFALATIATACDDATSDPGPEDGAPSIPDAAMPDAQGNDGQLPDAGDSPSVGTFDLTAGPFRVDPGVEQTMCLTLSLGNSSPAMVRAIRTTLSPGSHHMILNRVDEGPEQTDARPCNAFAHTGDLIFLAQSAEASVAYPEGVALEIQANQLIGIEIHYINYIGDTPIDIMGSIEFDLVEPDPSLQPVQIRFDGNLNLILPPREESTVRSTHSLPAGANVFALTTHTHQLGVESTLTRIGGAESTLLHRSTTWAEPPLDMFSPALVLRSTEELELVCRYQNTTDETVIFGTGFQNEMCFYWAFYY
jgi:hypothetical protein